MYLTVDYILNDRAVDHVGKNVSAGSDHVAAEVSGVASHFRCQPQGGSVVCML